jgi:hypothetical protein
LWGWICHRARSTLERRRAWRAGLSMTSIVGWPSPGAERARTLSSVLIVVGALLTALGVGTVVWLAMSAFQSGRIQSGPRVAATIVAKGAVSGDDQTVTLRYADRAGRSHLVKMQYPLGRKSGTTIGWRTAVVYDPSSPDKAEFSGLPRTRWQTVAAVAALVAVLTGAWLLWALALRLKGTAPGSARSWAVAAVTGIGVALLIGGRIGVIVARATSAPLMNDAPNPPAAKVGRPAKLPAVLHAPAPSNGPLVTPAEAQRVVEALWPMRDRATANRDIATLRAIETGPALASDVETIDSGSAPERITPDRRPPPEMVTLVPLQTHWPIRFLTEAITTAAEQPAIEFTIFTRRSPTSAWRVAYDNDATLGASPGFAPFPAILDHQGYDIVPSGHRIAASRAVPALAAYWQGWIDTGAPKNPPGTFFADGSWTVQFGMTIAGQQDKRGSNGLISHVSYGDRPVPQSEVWTFGIAPQDELVCSPTYETVVYWGTQQNAERQQWGPELAPGQYRSVTDTEQREPCVVVPPLPGALAAIGADQSVLRTIGQRW